MTNERISMLWEFQACIKSGADLKAAEEQIKAVKHSLEDSVLRLKDSGNFSEEENAKYKEAEINLLKVQDYIFELMKETEKKRGAIGYKLEKLMEGGK